MNNFTEAQWWLLEEAEQKRKMGAPASARWFVRAAQALAPLSPGMVDQHAKLIQWADALNNKEAA